MLAEVAQRVVMLGRQAIGRGPLLVARRGGVTWNLDLREGIDFAIFLLGMFEPDTVRCYRALIRPGDTVIDIGANIGAHTLHLAAAAGPNGSVIACEPTAFAFAKLEQNLALNPALRDRVELYQGFLVDGDASDMPAAVCSSWPLDGGGGRHSGHLGQLKSTSGAIAITLDELLSRSQVSSVALVKMDVDGFECQVLRGAASLFSRHRPVFLMELSPYVLAENGGSIEELVKLFKDADYEFVELAGKPVPMDPKVLESYDPNWKQPERSRRRDRIYEDCGRQQAL